MSTTPLTFGLTVPFELSPAWYSAYLQSADPEREFGIPVVRIQEVAPTKILKNPQPGFIVIVDRVYWADASDRREQRRAECEDGISWLSSSSTRPCVITLPCGHKLVTEYLYRRDRSQSDNAVHSLQKHEIWLLDQSYELVTKTGEAPNSSSRTSVRRPSTPMPSRCLVHYIDKKHAVHHMRPPRVHRVLQPVASYARPEDMLLARTQLEPLVGDMSSKRNDDSVSHQLALSANLELCLSPIVEGEGEGRGRAREPASRASPSDQLFVQHLPTQPARAAARAAPASGGAMRRARAVRAPRGGGLSSPYPSQREAADYGQDDAFGFIDGIAINEMIATRMGNPSNILNSATLGLAGQAIHSQDLASFLDRDEDILGAFFSFESS